VNVSSFTNDVGYLTSSTVGDRTINIKRNNTLVDSFSTNESGGTAKDINITVPVNVSDLNNDSNFITTSAAQSYTDQKVANSIASDTLGLFAYGSTASPTFTTDPLGNAVVSGMKCFCFADNYINTFNGSA